MPLQAALPNLEKQLEQAFIRANKLKKPEIATKELARQMALAIHAYAVQATVNPGQLVVGTSPSGPVTGTTTTPGTLS